MSSQHCTNNTRITAIAALLLVLVGCASGPQPGKNTAAGNNTVGADGQPLETRDIPQNALTLYEQAVAALASGDSIDAELRFQEFLLQYPDYPGAHVNLAI
ncbi:MAG: hypothetical protein ACR2QR_10860, partial [Woeseiaceae bacterium]